MKYLFIFLTFIITQSSFAQNTKHDNVIYRHQSVDEMPYLEDTSMTYDTGLHATHSIIYQYLLDNITLPAYRQRCYPERQYLFIRMVIDKNGLVDYVGLIRKTGYEEVDKQIVELLKKLKFESATLKGKKVSCELPIIPIKIVGSLKKFVIRIFC